MQPTDKKSKNTGENSKEKAKEMGEGEGKLFLFGSSWLGGATRWVVSVLG